MEREYLLNVDVSAGNVEREIAMAIPDEDGIPINTFSAGCGQGTLTLICC